MHPLQRVHSSFIEKKQMECPSLHALCSRLLGGVEWLRVPNQELAFGN